MERDALNNPLCRVFQSFDEKDWSVMWYCLAGEVCKDYSSFRAVEPSLFSGDWEDLLVLRIGGRGQPTNGTRLPVAS